MKILEYLKSIENIELYIIGGFMIFTLWFILNTIKFYKGEKRNVKHLHRFAKEGEVDAQSNLAKRYEQGNMIKKSCNRAAFWYQKASLSGNKEAKESLETILKKKKR